MVDPESLDGALALASHWVAMTEEPTKPKSSNSKYSKADRVWIIIARIVVIICFGGLGFVGGAFLWVMFSGLVLMGDGHWDSLFLWSGISAVIGGFIGYGISRWIK